MNIDGEYKTDFIPQDPSSERTRGGLQKFVGAIGTGYGDEPGEI